MKRLLRIVLCCMFSLGTASVKADLLFGPASLVTELNSSGSERLSWLSTDGLTAIISSNRLGTNDLFSATRADINSPFSTPTLFPFTAVNNATFNSDSGVMSADGLELFYHAASSSNPINFFRAVRPNTSVAFTAGSQVTTISVEPGGNFNRPSWLSADGNRLYYNTDGGKLRLATRTLPSTPFTRSVSDPFAMINDTGNASVGTLTPDELTVVFASSRAGGVGGFDFWMSTRTSISASFGAPINVSSLNTSGHEFGGWLASDRMYFVRNGDIYSAAIVVPEPSSMAILFGAMLLSGYHRYRRTVVFCRS